MYPKVFIELDNSYPGNPAMFLSFNSDFAWNNGLVELGHVRVKYTDVQSE